MQFEFHQPSLIEEAIALAGKHAPDACFIAGGTDLMIQMSRHKVTPSHVIDLTRVNGLSDISECDDGFKLGALVKLKVFDRDPRFQRDLLALVEATRVVGGHQVRNIATIGGNVVNASPAADVIPALMVLDSKLTLCGVAGERMIALSEFLVGPGRTVRQPDEVLTAIRFARLAPASATAFLKAGRRKAMEISLVCVAARITQDADGTCSNVRLALGAVGPTTFRPLSAEKALEGVQGNDENFRRAARFAAEACQSISDVRASKDYRSLLAEVLVFRALRLCAMRIAGAHQ